MELSFLEKERVYFHLGYGNKAGIDAGDLAQVEEACSNISSSYMYNRVLEQLDLCDFAWEASKLTTDTDRYTTRESYQGDINRSIIRDDIKENRIWWQYYFRETENLAHLLWVPNYRRDGMDRYRYERSAGAFIKAIPGPADTAVSSRKTEIRELGGGFGFL